MTLCLGEINTTPAPTPSLDEYPSKYNFHRRFLFSADRGATTDFFKGKILSDNIINMEYRISQIHINCIDKMIYKMITTIANIFQLSLMIESSKLSSKHRYSGIREIHFKRYPKLLTPISGQEHTKPRRDIRYNYVHD
jgi:hypothetical protein